MNSFASKTYLGNYISVSYQNLNWCRRNSEDNEDDDDDDDDDEEEPDSADKSGTGGGGAGGAGGGGGSGPPARERADKGGGDTQVTGDAAVGRRPPQGPTPKTAGAGATRTAKKRPLECYVCAYKSETPLRACLDPTKFRSNIFPDKHIYVYICIHKWREKICVDLHTYTYYFVILFGII